MQTTTINRSRLTADPVSPYPNAATKQELLHKFLDLLLVALIGAGLSATMLFLFVLG